jgi:hypothetical protein
MDASLDTNVIMHLYKANLQSVLFNRFQKVKVYEFIRNHEMQNHAEPETIDLFDKDVEAGKIELISNDYLKSIGMYNVFLQHVKDLRILFNGGDLGEVYAISMAKTLGCICLVTDDIKERGPHYTLMRIPDSDVKPFSFYEILFFDYLEAKLNEEELMNHFNTICELSDLTWDCSSKLKEFMRRFAVGKYSESEKEWFKDYCQANQINARERIERMIAFLNKNQRTIL